MPFSPSNAAKEIVKQAAIQLNSAGYGNLNSAVGGSPPTGYDLNTAYAPWDGFLAPLTKPFATSFANGTNQTVAAGSGFTTLTGSAWSVTPACPRDMLLTAQLTGLVGTAVNLITFRVRFAGTAIATGQIWFNQNLIHATMPLLQGIVSASLVSYPLASQTVDIQISTPAGTNFSVDGNDMFSYSLS